MKDLIYSGSVKDIFSSPNNDELVFVFSDRYSVFDWGEMPDLLNSKGRALSFMGKFFFELVEDPSFWSSWSSPMNLDKWQRELLSKFQSTGLKTHYIKEQIEENSLKVKKINVPKLKFLNGSYDYSFYQSKPSQCLIPLEVVFRFGMPAGSSLIKRIDDEDYCSSLGLRNIPKVGETFQKAVIEYSTKLESRDRYVTYDEAQKLAGLDDTEFAELHNTTLLLAMRLKDFFSECSLELWDGKFEWAFDISSDGKRSLMLVDSIGPDELRLSYDNQKLSKEFLRTFYRESKWLEALERAKVLASERGVADWKKIVVEEYGLFPEKLSSDYKKCADSLYPALANHLADTRAKQLPFKEEFNLKNQSKLMKKLMEDS